MAAPHPALSAGRVAVLTGAAGGIGLAMARKCVGLGMKVLLGDIDGAALEKARESLVVLAGGDSERVQVKIVDVGNYDSVEAFKVEAYEKFGEVAFLFSNAGIQVAGTGPYSNRDSWTKTLQVNLWGVINTTQAFTQGMIDQGTDCLIVNTGSKQGITCPPGNLAYNVSKAGVKVLTEGLQHQLRGTPDCKVTAAMLVPGWVNTELQRRDLEARGQSLDTLFFSESKPQAGAWMPDQIIDYCFQKLSEQKFYIICPDNDVTEDIDRKRMRWSASDVSEGRTPLSRWDPAYKAEFEAFMAA